MCLCCQSNTFSFSEQSNSNIFLIYSGFSNFLFSKDTNIFPDQILNFFTEFNSIETPFNDSDHPVSIDSKYNDINDFSKLNINKNSSLATFRLILYHYQNILIIYKIFCLYSNIFLILLAFQNIKLIKMNVDFALPGYTFYFSETENSHGGAVF